MADLTPEIEQQLAGMNEGEWAVLTAKVRAPDTAEQLKSIASKVISGPQLDAFTAAADTSKFVGDNGQIDESKVMGHLTALFGVSQEGPPHEWGQNAAPQIGLSPMQQGLAEAARRGYVGDGAPKTPPGANREGLAEAKRRGYIKDTKE